MRAGDHIRHKPSGEEWVVAYAEGEHVCACGWPHSLARRSDCELIKAASDAEHRALLVELAELNDSRGVRARRAIEAIDMRGRIASVEVGRPAPVRE